MAAGITTNPRHVYVYFCNLDVSKTLYWGIVGDASQVATITTASGMPLPPGPYSCLGLTELAGGQLLYGVATTGTIDVRVTEAFPQ